MEAALDGVALAKMLQDGPRVVQVAGCGQPHRDSHALKGEGRRPPCGVPGPGLAPH